MRGPDLRTILVFSDLHANKKALDTLVSAIEKASLSIFCGDLLGYGTDIDYCLDYVLDNVDIVVRGDHERMAITGEELNRCLPVVKESTLRTRSRLSDKQRARLSSLPTEVQYEDMYVTHSIDDDYLRTPSDFQRLIERMPKGANYAFFGHTHEQVMFRSGNKRIINPGSITKGRRGFSRSYALLTDGKVEFVNLEAIL
jgi:predicted phosphodiesterase